MTMTSPSSSVLRLDARFESLAEVRLFVQESLARLGATEDQNDALVHAADEAATNVIEHGYGGGPGSIEILVERDGEEFAVRLRDGARVFDPTGHPPPDLSLSPDQRPLGGLGIHIMRSLVNRMRHRPLSGGGNELSLFVGDSSRRPEGRP